MIYKFEICKGIKFQSLIERGLKLEVSKYE